MSNDDQAFPKGQDADHGNSGMTLLHYFMAHAPQVPGWFEPKMEQRPKMPPRWESFVANHQHKDYIKKYWDDEGDCFVAAEEPVPLGLNAEIRAYSDEFKQKYDAIQAWDKTQILEQYLQWPRYWAEEQIRRAN